MDPRHLLIAQVLAGAIGAAVSDLHAYSESPDGASFNWRKAVARWVAGGLAVVTTMQAAGFAASLFG